MSAEAKASEHEGGLALKLPYQLGRFTLCRELGAGGMATVYVGKMRLGEGLDRLVALKTIHSHLAKTKTFVDMFLDEAKIASQISHPNVCSVYDFGSVGGTYFLALEYLVGEPLFDFINRVVDKHDDELMRALPYLAARILADACEGLHAAHETRGPDGRRLNVVHRDVSPQNLFITYEGAVKVVDFGCAKAIERVTQTDTGIMKGKVSYAAPEQLKVGELDARADVWALGVCLWETLTLESLFSRDTAIQTAMAVLEGPIPRADETHAWVPRELADIAEKALQRDPAKRYPSAREMGRDLRHFIARSGVSFESAELADWMSYLFAQRKDEVLSLVAAVEAQPVSVHEPSPARREIRKEDSSGLAQAATKLAKVSSGETSAPATATPERETVAPPRSSGRRALRLEGQADEEPVALPTKSRAWIGALIAVLALAAGAAAAYQLYGVELGLRAPAAASADTAGESEIVTDTVVAPEPGVDPAIDPSAQVEPTALEPAPAVPEPAAPQASAPEPAAPEPAAPEPAAPEPAPAVAAQPAPTRPATPPIATQQNVPRPPAPEPSGPVAGSERPPSASLDTSQGEVVVNADGGWAEVYLGDRHLGRTPLRTRIPVGRQSLRLLPYGREPAQYVTVPAEWGAVNRITIRLGPSEPLPDPDRDEPDQAPLVTDSPY